MDNVQGSIEHDSDEEIIRPDNLSDEFEEIAMVIPTMEDDQDYEEIKKDPEIMENISNMVDMLNAKVVEESKDNEGMEADSLVQPQS